MSFDMSSTPSEDEWWELYEQHREEIEAILQKSKFQRVGPDGILKDARTGRPIPLSELSDQELINFALVMSLITPEEEKRMQWPVAKVRQALTAEIRRRGLPHPGD